MENLKIPALIIRSIDTRQISALQDLGLDIPIGDGEVDVLMAYVSGDLLHVNIFEVKRADTYPWQQNDAPPNKQAVKFTE